MVQFAFAVLLLIASPGPGVLSLAGVGAAFGFRQGLAYFWGLFIGTNLVAIAVISGISAAVLAIPELRRLLLGLSTLYLLYLAAKIAFAGSRIALIEATARPGVRAGVTLQIINPKAYVVYTTLFSGFPVYPSSLTLEIIYKLISFNVIWGGLHLIWLWVGSAIARLDLAPEKQRAVNIAMACSMLGVVALAAFSAS